MEIVWLAHSCFRLRAREATIVTDPPGGSFGSLGNPQADIVTVSHPHTGHDNVSAVSGEPIIVMRPGEYEIKDVVIRGISSFHDAARGEERGRNTIFLMELEGMTVCHLGDLGHVPSAGQVEDLGIVDILLVPVGGVTTIGASRAAEIISLVTPRIVIPMHYQDPRARPDLEPLEHFAREMAVTDVTAQQRVSITRSALPQDTQIMILERRRS